MNHPFRKKWGQNFLQDPNFIKKIAACVHPDPADVILEIGPGSGALTRLIAGKASKIIAVEIDPLLIEPLKKNLPANVEVIQADFMKFEFDQIPAPYKIVGNLPYYITTPILFRVLENPGWERGVFMVQKELGERLFASPNTKSYGRLSVMIQAGALIHKEFTVPPTVFYPQPSVGSIVITMIPHERQGLEMKLFSEIVRLAFGQRRKKLRNTISTYLSGNLMVKYGDKRPEMLPVEEFITISNCCNRP